MTSTVTEKTPKINVDAARDLCQSAVFVAGEGYVCPADKPGLVQTALTNSDYELAQELLDLIGDQGFTDAFRSSPELQEIIGLDAAWYFQGADEADDQGNTWEQSMEKGQEVYETCWEEHQAHPERFSLDNIDPAVYDNFSI